MCVEGVPNIGRGILYIIMATVYLRIYLLVILIMCKPQLRSQSCYKVMIAIGFGHNIGYWSIIGSTYCQNYWHMKVAGAIVGGAWAGYCCLCLVLGFNRLQQSSNMSGNENSLFIGFRTFSWIGLCVIIAAIRMMAYLSPQLTLVYHSQLGLWMSGSQAKALATFLHFSQNTVFSMIICMLYAVLVYRIWNVAHLIENSPITATERDIYIQSGLISLFTVVLSLSYLILPLVTTNLDIFVALQFYAMFVQGSNPFIYLIFNQTIRNTLGSMIYHQNTAQIIEVQPVEQPINGSRMVPRPATIQYATADQSTRHDTKPTDVE